MFGTKYDTSNNFYIRKATKKDVDKIMNMFESLNTNEQKFLAYNQKKTTIRQIIRSGRHCFVAILDNTIVGFIRESGRPNNFSLLEECVVHPDYRNKHIAKKLLKYYHNIFNKNLAKSHAKNYKMNKLLTSFGYKIENPDGKKILYWIRESD